MKKLLFIFLTIFVVSGCSFNDDKFTDEAKMDKFSGILSENPAKIQKPEDPFISTHILTTDEDSIIPLSCLAFNLSDPLYLGNKVQVIGVMDDQTNIFQVTSISVLERITTYDYTKPKLTTYKNNKLGFEIQYLNNWNYIEMEKKVIFSAPQEFGTLAELNQSEPSRMIIEQIDYVYEPSVFEMDENPNPLKNYISLNFPLVDSIDDNISKIGTDLLDAVKFSGQGSFDYYIYRPDYIYKISYVSASSPDNDFENDFNEMLSKFRFIPISDIPSGNSEIKESIDNETIEDIDSDMTEKDDSLSNNDSSSSQNDSYNYVEPTDKFSTFEAVAFNFKADYPAKWYYEATQSSSDSLRHYSFSQKPLEESVESYGLDLYKGEVPKVDFITVNGTRLFKTSSGSTVSYFIEVDGKNYKISGDKEFEEFIIKTALSIQSIE